MYAKRMNRTYSINTPQEKQSYLARGYDIFDEDDDLVEASPQKTVAYSEFQKLQAVSNAMRRELVAVRAENERLKGQLTALADDMPQAIPPAGVMEAFDAPPSMPAPEDEIKTLHSQDQPAPKMGKSK